MIAAFDVQYDDRQARARAAGVLFARWNDAEPAAEYTVDLDKIQPYVPGEFFRRELPCLLAVIERIEMPLNQLVIDGYVQLDDRPGLGQHLFDHFHGTIPVIGVAKTRFRDANAVEITRGTSGSPLYITAAGISAEDAAADIRRMHGPHRIPTLLKRVDTLARSAR